ncbi:MAG: CHAP domain-containing protein [Rhodoglobus sp.]
MTKSSETDSSVTPRSSGLMGRFSRTPSRRGRRRGVPKPLVAAPAVDSSHSLSRPGEVGRSRTEHKHPAAVLLTMVAVGGMFMVVGLPAYAVNPVDAVARDDVKKAAVQSFVADAAAMAPVSRDIFTATTPEEIAAAKLALQRAAAASLASRYVYRDPGPRQAGDDYPFVGMGEGLSPLRYYLGECVDFVAWRLNRDAGSVSAPFRWDWSSLTPGGGSAHSWRGAWASHGWPVSDVPVPGSVAVTGYNHVAYVKEVRGDGTVLIEEYNYSGYHQYGQRVIAADSATYLYPPG